MFLVCLMVKEVDIILVQSQESIQFSCNYQKMCSVFNVFFSGNIIQVKENIILIIVNYVQVIVIEILLKYVFYVNFVYVLNIYNNFEYLLCFVYRIKIKVYFFL